MCPDWSIGPCSWHKSLGTTSVSGVSLISIIDLGLIRWIGGKQSACNAGDTGDVCKLLFFLTTPLSWEDPLEEEMTTHCSILALRIPWTEEPGGLQSTGSQRVGHDWPAEHGGIDSSLPLVESSLALTAEEDRYPKSQTGYRRVHC